MRALVVVWDGGGTVGPALGLSAALATRGHDVRVLGSPWLAERVERAGVRHRVFTTAAEPAPSSSLAIEDQLGEYLEFFFGSAPGDDVAAELEREGADVVVVDCMLANVLSRLEAVPVPTAVLVHLPYAMAVDGRWLDGWTWAIPALNELRAPLGLDAFATDRPLWAQAWGRAGAVLATTIPSFDGATYDGVHYVGPLREPVAAAPLTAGDLGFPPGDEPLVLASLSTSYMHQQPVLAAIAGALAQLHVRGVVTTGKSIDVDSIPRANNVVVRQWIPHDLVLAEAALVVTHAGHGTTLAALAAGKPLVCLPMGRDQDAIAERVVELGAGVALAPAASSDDIAAAIAAVLASDDARRGAQAVAADLAAVPPSLATETVERAAAGN